MYIVMTTGDEVEYATLPRAVRAILDLPGKRAQLSFERTGQVAFVDGTPPARVTHIVHGDQPFFEGERPEFERGSIIRYNERPLLNAIANQLKRFTRAPVQIFDSRFVN